MSAVPASSASATPNGATKASVLADPYTYMHGFGNSFETEALPGSLPVHRNTPQKCAHGLYAEQLNGTAFTAPRVANQRSWLYRIRPAAGHDRYVPLEKGRMVSDFDAHGTVDPNQYRWMPLPLPGDDARVKFWQGLTTYGGAGSPITKVGFAVHLYAFNASMDDEAFINSDGDMLIVPQLAALDVRTELGCMLVQPGDICVVPRGIRFAVNIAGDATAARGYVCELFQGHFKLPDLGPIGANGLANARDFETPVAWYEDRECAFTLVHKFGGELFAAAQDHSAFDVVAWHGNYAPYKYTLSNFNTVNSVSYDHLDPSIFTVLTAPTAEPGVAVIDFVIFPPRWSVQEDTFRPPYYHRNCMSEFMGLVFGIYEAKERGFVPGGATLHSCMTAHGVERDVFLKASEAPLAPQRVAEGSMAFMFESTYIMKLTEYATTQNIDDEYHLCWKGLPKLFKAPQ